MKKKDDDKDSYLSDEELLSVLSEIVSIAKLLVNRNFSDDPILQRQKKRFAGLPPEVRDKINALDNMHPRDYQLKVIKRKRTKPQEGDIFVVCPREGLYFYGRVLKADIKHIRQSETFEGKHVIVVFKTKTRNLDLSDYSPDYEDLLIEPSIVDGGYWRCGWFYTIANVSLDDYEKALDYGFYDVIHGKFCTAEGNELDHEPKHFTDYMLSSFSMVARYIEREAIINPDLLKFN
ncbi:MAG TPA: immunity 26/phosphotriesterase HocA family protein [Bacillota bacterium]|nr:immunity 26/phosphotriesterase HocA family protein [Bacillota bacterium]